MWQTWFVKSVGHTVIITKYNVFFILLYSVIYSKFLKYAEIRILENQEPRSPGKTCIILLDYII